MPIIAFITRADFSGSSPPNRSVRPSGTICQVCWNTSLSRFHGNTRQSPAHMVSSLTSSSRGKSVGTSGRLVLPPWLANIC
jgi:hypothetical protein